MELPRANDNRQGYAAQPTHTEAVATGVPVRHADRYYHSDNPRVQPTGAVLFQPETPRPWSSGLCDCCSDRRNCCLTCLCPCVTFGQIAEIIDEGTISRTASGALYAVIQHSTGHPCMYSCFYRSRLRQRYNLKESPCNDCLVHCCCECCALCQEYRELQNQGFDMVIGWHANIERRNRGVGMTPTAPIVEPGMRRDQ